MQHDDGGDPDFWGPEQPTRQLRRVQPGSRPPGTRQHGETGTIPVVPTSRRRALEAFGARAIANSPDPEATRQLRRVNVLERPATRTSATTGTFAADPLVRRVGIVIAAIIVLIPVAVALRSDPKATLRAADAPADLAPDAGATTAVILGSTPALAAQVIPVAPATTTPPSYYVAAELPPAVPVVTQPASTDPATADPAAIEPATTAGEVSANAAPATTTAPQAAAAEASGPTCTKTYTVVGGDFWIGIAKRAQVTLKELLRANNAKSSTKLFPGRSICLPANAVTPVPAAQPATTPAPTTTVKPTAPKQPAPAPAPAPATTVKPPPTTTPSAPPPANNYSREQVIQIIRDVWPDDLEEEAIRIATRESNLKPTVRNYCCFGLFQIYYSVHKRWLADLGITSAEMLYDPRANATAALTLYVRAGGWGPWAL